MAEEKKKKSKASVTEFAPMQTNVQEEESTIDLYELLLQFLDKWRWIALSAIAGAILILMYTIWFVVPEYKATSKIYVVNAKDSVVNLSDLQISNYLAQDYTEVFSNWELHATVINQLKDLKENADDDALDEWYVTRDELNSLNIDDYTYKKLGEMVSVSNPQDTRILYITVTSDNNVEARILANVYATCGSEFIAKRMDTNEPKSFERARTPLQPSSPNKTRNAIIGFLLGAVIAIAVITLRFLVDDYVRTADDVEKYLHLPTLGTIMLQKHSDDEAEAEPTRKKKGESRHGDDDE